MARSVPAVSRALAVLRFLASQPRPVTATTLARELGIPRSSTYHLLKVMEAERFVTYLPEDRRYGLGVAALEFGLAYARQDGLERLARPLLIKLVEQVHATAHLGILDGREIVYLLEQRPATPAPLVTDIGVRLPAHLTASGRAILSHLPPAQVLALYPTNADLPRRTATGPDSRAALRRELEATRRRALAIEDGEVSVGYLSAALAVFDHTGRPTAAVAVTVAQSEDPAEQTVCDLVPPLREAAEALTRRLRGVPPSAASSPQHH